MQHSTLETARRHLIGVDPAALLHSRNRLAETGMARLGFLLPHQVKRALAAEALELVEHHRHWGELLPGGTEPVDDPPRHRIEVPPQAIATHANLIPQLYDCDVLRRNLSVVAAESVLPCPEPRRYAVTRVHHDELPQWHWDDYSFALVLVVECPPLEEGGFVQTVAHTHRDRQFPDVHRTLTRNPIHSWELHPGDLYLMRTASTLHRVYPFEHGRRTIMSMCFATRADLDRPDAARAAGQSENTPVGRFVPVLRVMTDHRQ
ncbi:hypothetical protein HLB23_18030 [Nocardia uniformis]|uniref:Uncharacterized protein n=1 Tax=Nocardia uniformis TaxID=53432 RepID=A0A849C797_9NOCA|nr:hypothetical protein [Nocardia uniformis]NNH71737.1 hypothetical protein [Nocardia uniformis]